MKKEDKKPAEINKTQWNKPALIVGITVVILIIIVLIIIFVLMNKTGSSSGTCSDNGNGGCNLHFLKVLLGL